MLQLKKAHAIIVMVTITPFLVAGCKKNQETRDENREKLKESLSVWELKKAESGAYYTYSASHCDERYVTTMTVEDDVVVSRKFDAPGTKNDFIEQGDRIGMWSHVDWSQATGEVRRDVSPRTMDENYQICLDEILIGSISNTTFSTSNDDLFEYCESNIALVNQECIKIIDFEFTY